MNDKTIKEIYFGDRCPADSRFDNGSEYARKLKEQQKLYDQVEKALPDAMQKTLEELILKDNELSALSALDAFIKGFRLGMQLTVEGLDREQENKI